MNEFMKLGFERAMETMKQNIGGPFGACIIDSKGNVLSIASNTVLKDNDPTAHAEMNAIRQACEKIGSYDLSDCILYATGYPCPMCLSAIIWSNIKTVYYATNLEDAEKLGFRDDFIYNFIKDKDESVLKLEQMDREECKKLFEKYSELNKVIY